MRTGAGRGDSGCELEEAQAGCAPRTRYTDSSAAAESRKPGFRLTDRGVSVDA